MKKFNFTINGNNYEVEIQSIEGKFAHVEVNGTVYNVEIHKDMPVTKTPTLVRTVVPPPTRKETKISKTIVKTTNNNVKAPLPGTIVKVFVNEGDKVTIGQKLLMMEAMKMENNVFSEKDGEVKLVKVKDGQTVMQNDLLLVIE